MPFEMFKGAMAIQQIHFFMHHGCNFVVIFNDFIRLFQ
jgi:hypothetical protein